MLRFRFLFAALAAIAILLVAPACTDQSEAPRFKLVDVTGATFGKELALTDHNGQRRTLADFRGKVVTVFFGFTHCPDVCPTTLGEMAVVMKELGNDAGRLQVLFVTVDPGRDTPQVLAQYVPAFHPSFLGLYGDEDAIARTAQEFKIYYKAHAPDHRGAYAVDHSGQVFVFDKAGRLRLLVSRSSEATPDSVAHDLRVLIEEPAA